MHLRRISGLNLIFLLLAMLLVNGNLVVNAANPFADDEKVTIKESASLDASEAKFNKVQKGASKDDSRDKPVVVAVLSDLHCRPANVESLLKAIRTINKMPDIYAAAITGDLNEKIGSPAEYKYLVKALSHFSVPVFAVPGNHDVQYKDYYNPNKNAKNPKLRTNAKERKAKLERFRNLLKLKALRFSRKVGGHLLVFLPDDHLTAKRLVTLSDATLKFLRETLKKNKDMPTLVFCHGPLLGSYNRKGGLPLLQATAQPSAKIHNILKDNPQVFLWVSGHTHTGPSSKNFCAKVNKVGKVTNIHTPAIQPGSSYIQVLKLSPKQAVVRTLNTKTGKFIKKFDRVFKHKIADKDKDKEKKEDETKNPPVVTPLPEDKDDDVVVEDDTTEPEETAIEEETPETSVENDPEEEINQEVDEDPESEDNGDSETAEELEETADDPDESVSEPGIDSDDAATDKNSAAIERIRELIAIALEYINNLFTDFIRILRP